MQICMHTLKITMTIQQADIGISVCVYAGYKQIINQTQRKFAKNSYIRTD